MSLPLIFLLPLLIIFPIPCMSQQGLWASEVLWVPLERGSCPGPQLPRQVQQHRRLGRLSTGWEPLREAAGPVTSAGQLGRFVSGRFVRVLSCCCLFESSRELINVSSARQRTLGWRPSLAVFYNAISLFLWRADRAENHKSEFKFVKFLLQN